MATIGTTLRAARVNRGLSIEQAAQDTRISRKFLEAIEAEDFAALPAPVYVRGFLRSYANYLRVDPAPLLQEVAAILDAPVGGPDGFVGGPRNRGNQPPQTPPARGGNDPWRRRGVAPQPSRAPEPDAANEEVEDGYGESVRPQNLRLRESRGDVGFPERPRGVVPNPPSPPESRDEPATRREPLAPLSPPPRPSFPVRSRVEPPSPPVIADDDYPGDTEAEYYEDDDQDGVTPPPYVPAYGFDGDEQQPYRRRSAEMYETEERGAGGIPPIAVAIAGGVGILALFLAVAFFLLRDDDETPAVPTATNTPGTTITQTVVVGTGTATAGASPSASASASAAASRTGTATRTTTGTPAATNTPSSGTATPTPTAEEEETPTPTAEPTETETPTPEPTATEEPATPTPVPPTATPTQVLPTATPTVPIPAHALGFGECAGGNCGESPYLVVCAPDGWFIDVDRDWPNPGFPVAEVVRAIDAQSVCS